MVSAGVGCGEPTLVPLMNPGHDEGETYVTSLIGAGRSKERESRVETTQVGNARTTKFH